MNNLENLQLHKMSKQAGARVKEGLDHAAKPLDSLGVFEDLLVQVGSILGQDNFALQKAIIVMCADNGVVEEGVTQTGQEVTAIVAGNMAKGEGNVCKMAALSHTKVIPVDIGMAHCAEMENEQNYPVVACVRRGTHNFAKEPAMSMQEAYQAIFVGMDLVEKCKKQGFTILGTGEMGIGNTTTSAAVTAALLGISPMEVTGRGAGLSTEGLHKKQQVIKDALARYEKEFVGTERERAMQILSHVGGFDIAGMTGVFLGGAVYGIPIVIDGVISAVAALLAEHILPGAKAYMIASHMGKEPAMPLLLKKLELTPVIFANLALGEGSGCAMLFSLLDQAMRVYEGKTFLDISVAQYERFEKDEQ